MKTTIMDERAELHTMHELVDMEGREYLANDFEYLNEDDDWHEPRIIRLTIGDAVDYFDVLDTMVSEQDGWDARIDDTFFSQFVVKFLDGDDEGFVRVGFQVT